MKKALNIFLIILLASGVIFSVWYFFLQKPAENTVENPFSNSLPFGNGDNVTFPTSSSGETGQNINAGIENGKPASDLFRITASPVAGAVVLGEGASTTVRYVERATGHIYETNLTTLKTRKILNTTLPKIYEAFFSQNGNKVLFRSLSDNGKIEDLSLNLIPPDSESESSGSSDQLSTLYTSEATVLNGDIKEVIAGEGNSLFYVLGDDSSISSSTFEGTSQKTIFSSPFTAWRLGLLDSGILIWTKASANVPGYAYKLNTSNGRLSKLLGPLNGLSVKSSADGNRLAFSYNKNGAHFFTRNTQSSTDAKEILPTTLAEKCVWSELESTIIYCGAPINGVGTNEPDDWYKGITHFSDRIWRFDVEIEGVEILAEPKNNYGVDIDATELKLSSDEGYLVFTNRNDLSLWALKLK